MNDASWFIWLLGLSENQLESVLGQLALFHAVTHDIISKFDGGKEEFFNKWNLDIESETFFPSGSKR